MDILFIEYSISSSSLKSISIWSSKLSTFIPGASRSPSSSSSSLLLLYVVWTKDQNSKFGRIYLQRHKGHQAEQTLITRTHRPFVQFFYLSIYLHTHTHTHTHTPYHSGGLPRCTIFKKITRTNSSCVKTVFCTMQM